MPILDVPAREPGTDAGLAVAQAVLAVQHELASADLDAQRVMEVVARVTCGLVGATGATVEVRDGDELVCRAVAGTSPETVGTRRALGSSLSGLCARVGSALRSDDTEADDRVDLEACRRIGVRSLVVVPLDEGPRCDGVLKVLSPEPYAFDDTVETTLQAMATFVTAALRRTSAGRPHDDPLAGMLDRTELVRRLGASLQQQLPADVTVVVVAVGAAPDHEALADVATALQRVVRGGDAPARLAADRFAVLCHRLPVDEAPLVAGRVATAVAHAARAGGSPRIGWARATAGETAQQLLDRAEAAAGA